MAAALVRKPSLVAAENLVMGFAVREIPVRDRGGDIGIARQVTGFDEGQAGECGGGDRPGRTVDPMRAGFGNQNAAGGPRVLFREIMEDVGFARARRIADRRTAMQQMRVPDEDVAFFREEDAFFQPGLRRRLVHRHPPIRHFGVDAVEPAIAEPVLCELRLPGIYSRGPESGCESSSATQIAIKCSGVRGVI